MGKFTTKQIQYLKGLAHHLEPVVILGKQGLTFDLCDEVSRALDDHELIKLKFNEHKEEKEEIAKDIASKTESHLVTIIGNIAIYYREHKDPRKRKIKLDKA